MKRKNKIWICFILMLLGLILMGGTLILAKANLVETKTESEVTNLNQNKNNEEVETTKSPNGEEPPAKPDEEENGTGGIIPEMQNPGTNMTFAKAEIPTLTIWYIVSLSIGCLLFTAGFIYFALSRFCQKEIFSNKDKITIYFLLTLMITTALSYALVIMTNKCVLDNGQTSKTIIKEINSNVSASGIVEVTSESKEITENTESTLTDESAILVTEKGTANVKDIEITKSGDTTNTENSEFYGVNAAVLVQANSKAVIDKTKIITDSKGSNAVFSTGENSVIEISNSIINTSSDSSRGLDATYGGTITADNVTINTKGQSCASLATDRGEGTVTVTNSNLNTAGKGSPVIYSTGNISITNSTGSALSSQMVVVEGKNSATIKNCTLTASGLGNRNDADHAGIMIYQSMSGDASEGVGTLTSEDSNLNISEDSSVYKTAPMFFITNTNAKINLKNTKLSYGSNILINASGTSEWGTKGSNGGHLEFNAEKEELSGNIIIDNDSSLELNLKEATLKGSINNEKNTGSITIKLDEDSTWNLTNDSYIKSIEDEKEDYSNIISNGFNIYYSGKETIDLDGGGKLIPNN